MDDPLLILESGPLQLRISAAIGGSIAAFGALVGERRVPILRECNSFPENVLDSASFPLVPFVNRIRGGHFTFRDRIIRLAPNMAGDPSPLHGQGWLRPWRVDRARSTEAVLGFTHNAGEWPWTYEARQHFRLDPGGLSLDLFCQNLSDGPMPCGLGQHPYFPCGPETRIDTKVTHAWTIDEHVLPVDKVAATGPFSLADRRVCGQGLDHGFGGWGGTARLTDPDWPFELILSSSDAGFFQLYSPKEGGLFVAEPVTHANAALNEPEEQWAEPGLRILEPGEAMSLSMRLEVRSLGKGSG